MAASLTERTVTAPEEPTPQSYDSDDIKRMLPHRWPMLMVDRAFDVIPGVSGRGTKCVSVNEPYFAGHYPDHSIMPGVLIVESLAQLVAIIYVAERLEGAPGLSDAEARSDVGYLGSISRMKFARLVRPGDQLTLEASLGQRFGALREANVTARVGRELVAQGSLVVTEGR